MMKYLAGVLALAALAAAGPEADPAYLYAPYTPYFYRPYAASGYAGPLPGHSYQAVHRLHKREAEADPQFLLNAAPFAPLAAPDALPLVAPAPIFATANAVANAPVVKSVVEHPAEVAHTVVATHHAIPAPLFHHSAPLFHSAPVVAPAVVHAAPAVVPAAHAAVAVGPHDCVTEAGCALRAALSTGLPHASFGSAATTVLAGRKRREAEAEPTADAEAEADPFLYYNNYFGGYPYAPAAYSAGYPYSAYPYAPAYPYYNNYLNPYNYRNAPLVAPAPVGPAAVEVAAPVVPPTPITISRPVAVSAPVYAAAPLPAVHSVPAPVVHAAPAVHTTAKQVTYTHLGAHPIAPTTVVQTESRLVL